MMSDIIFWFLKSLGFFFFFFFSLQNFLMSTLFWSSFSSYLWWNSCTYPFRQPFSADNSPLYIHLFLLVNGQYHIFKNSLPYKTSDYDTALYLLWTSFTFVFQNFFLRFHLVHHILLNFHLYLLGNHTERCRPRGKESTKVRKSQIKGREMWFSK